MKGKPTWKPRGMNAKKWRAASQRGVLQTCSQEPRGLKVGQQRLLNAMGERKDLRPKGDA
jgi:hypothetical protein